MRGEGFGLPWGGDVPTLPRSRDIPDPQGLEVLSGLGEPCWVLGVELWACKPRENSFHVDWGALKGKNEAGISKRGRRHGQPFL